MKIRVFIVMLTATLCLTACSAMGSRIDQAEDAVESKIETFKDAVENGVDKAENAVEQAMTPQGGQQPTTQATQSATQPTQATGTLTKEEAEDIALKHAGLTADQVTYLRADYEVDDGVPQYEVGFHQGKWEYDYEIHAETGEILSYDRDD